MNTDSKPDATGVDTMGEVPALRDDRHIIRTDGGIHVFEERPDDSIAPGGHAVMYSGANETVVHLMPLSPQTYALRRVEDGKVIKKGVGNPNNVIGLMSVDHVGGVEF